jgi:predicted amidohydrolase YtcJ
VLIARAELRPGEVRDLRLTGGRVVEVELRLRPRRDEDVLDASGHAVLPGLHDHHIHLRATAASFSSLDLRPVGTAAELTVALRDALAGLPAGEWLRVVGYHESIAGPLDRATLDRLTSPNQPVRVQHRSGILWVLNSAAITAAGLEQRDDEGVDPAAGHLWRRDDVIRPFSRLAAGSLALLGHRAAMRGVTGFTDATPATSVDHAHDLADELRTAGVVQNLRMMGPVGAIAPHADRVALGEVKILLDDDRLPALADLEAIIRRAHDEQRQVAVHCVTRLQLVVALAALDAAGAQRGDRIEHASVVPAELVGELQRLGVTVVTQPHFIAERGDEYLHDVEPDDLDSLYRVGSLARAGVPVAAGTDAPYGHVDPWRSIAAALRRRTPDGHQLGVDETVDLPTALSLYTGHADRPARRRVVAPGSPADLCVLEVAWGALADALDDPPVRATVIAGELAFHR